MTFLVIVICLLMQRYLGSISSLRDVKLFNFYYCKWNSLVNIFPWLHFGKSAWLQIISLWLPLLLLLYFCSSFATRILGVAGDFCWSLFCLWLCVDAYDPSWRQPSVNKNPVGNSLQETNNPLPIATAIFKASFSRIFVLLFCFAVAGPIAVVMYRALDIILQTALAANILSNAEGNTNSAIVSVAGKLSASSLQLLSNIRMVVDWIPARLLGLSYALIGSFGPTFTKWGQQFMHPGGDQSLLSATLGVTALDKVITSGCESLASQVQLMINRALILWLVGFSVLTMVRV